MQDGIIALITLALSLGWLLLVYQLAQHFAISQNLSRKIIHIGTGPLFVLCWPLFSDGRYSRLFAAVVPLGLTLMFGAVGLNLLKLPLLTKISTRSGNVQELLRGPMCYGIAFVVCTLTFWRTSPVGILALMVLCGGDGFADIVGRRWGSHKLPFSHCKSWIGSLAMFLASIGFGTVFLFLFNQWGYLQPSLASNHIVAGVIAIALVSTLVEALSGSDIDNITIIGTAIAMGVLVFYSDRHIG